MYQNKFYNPSSEAVRTTNLDDTIATSLETLRRWWWLPVIFLIVSLAAAHSYIKDLTPRYKSRAMIEVRQSEINSTGAGSVEQITANLEYLNTQMALVKSRSVLREIVIEELLDSDSRLVSSGSSPETRVDTVVGKVRGGLKINLLKNTRIIELTYESDDPTLAADIPNRVANGFVNYSLNRGSKTTNYAENVLEGNISQAREALEVSEKKLAVYARRNGLLGIAGSSGGEGGATLESNDLIQLNAQLRDAITEREKLQQYYNATLEGASASLVERDPQVREISRSIAELEKKYSSNLEIYREANPIMIDIQANIDKLEEDLELEYKSILAAARFELDAAFEIEAGLRARVNSLTSSITQIKNASIEYNILKREVETNRLQYDTLLQRIQEVAVVDNQGSNLVSIVDTATIPSRPFFPNKRMMYAMASGVGALSGVMALFLLSLFDNKVRDPEDISSGLNLPLLGVIPNFGAKRDIMQMLMEPLSPVSEAYATTQANVEISIEKLKNFKTLHVTSVRAGEGKSATVFALAKGFALSGRNTLLIDADMRRPTFRGVDGSTLGLSGILQAEDDLDLLTNIRPTSIEGLSLLPSGPIPTDPAHLLAKSRLGSLLNDLEKKFDVIVIDSPPVLGLSDSLSLASISSATIFVIEANALTSRAVNSVLSRLLPASQHLLGVIMTKYKASHGKYYYYSKYSYGATASQYGNRERKKSRKSAKKSINLSD